MPVFKFSIRDGRPLADLVFLAGPAGGDPGVQVEGLCKLRKPMGSVLQDR